MKYEIDFKDVQILEEKIKQLPNVAETEINKVLHTDGIELVEKHVTRLIPVSKRKKNTPWYLQNRKTKHARDTDWSKNEKENLGFTVKTKGGAANNKGSFGYLVFPDQGRGQPEQNFTERGAENALPHIINKLHGSLTELLGGSL